MIEVKSLVKEFEGKQVLRGLSTTFIEGKTNLIIGQSGAGKTVFLKCLIGMIEPTSGEILFDGKDLASLPPLHLKKLRLQMGVLFQGSALFDNMTVLGNVLFPLEMFSKISNSDKKEKAMLLIKKVGLEKAIHKYPSEISGGMMKRCAIARALVNDPKYLFCDEPNSGLDPQTGEIIDNLLSQLTHERNITTVINTHDMNSVKNIGEKIIFLDRGQKNWEGSYQEIEETGTARLKHFITFV
ncbi:ABC transporter, ATP-binding protein [Bacteroidales bacterium KA00251]|nr:ABC transporter, ATP-binding protein [Bacteroidales bacterium KA00251]